MTNTRILCEDIEAWITIMGMILKNYDVRS